MVNSTPQCAPVLQKEGWQAAAATAATAAAAAAAAAVVAAAAASDVVAAGSERKTAGVPFFLRPTGALPTANRCGKGCYQLTSLRACNAPHAPLAPGVQIFKPHSLLSLQPLQPALTLFIRKHSQHALAPRANHGRGHGIDGDLDLANLMGPREREREREGGCKSK